MGKKIELLSILGGLFGGASAAPSFGFGAPQTTTATPAFSFGTPQTSSAPTFGFGAPQVNATSAVPAFGFNSTQTTSAAPAFGFGATQTSTAAPSFGFGTQTSTAPSFIGTQPTPAQTFGFGQQPQTSNTGFSFGLGAPTVSSSGGLFSGTGTGFSTLSIAKGGKAIFVTYPVMFNRFWNFWGSSW